MNRKRRLSREFKVPNRLTKAFIPGIRLSQPSNPNLFSFGYFVETNLSNESEQISRSSILRFSSIEYLYGLGISPHSRNQSDWNSSGILTYSIPIVPPIY